MFIQFHLSGIFPVSTHISFPFSVLLKPVTFGQICSLFDAMASDLNSKVVTGVFLLGIGLGSTIGWHHGLTFISAEREGFLYETNICVATSLVCC